MFNPTRSDQFIVHAYRFGRLIMSISPSFSKSMIQLMKKSKKNTSKIFQRIAFGILILISIAIMALVLWINVKGWLS